MPETPGNPRHAEALIDSDRGTMADNHRAARDASMSRAHILAAHPQNEDIRALHAWIQASPTERKKPEYVSYTQRENNLQEAIKAVIQSSARLADIYVTQALEELTNDTDGEVSAASAWHTHFALEESELCSRVMGLIHPNSNIPLIATDTNHIISMTQSAALHATSLVFQLARVFLAGRTQEEGLSDAIVNTAEHMLNIHAPAISQPDIV